MRNDPLRCEVKVYLRQGCLLCDEVIKELASLQEEFPHTTQLIDIDQDVELQAVYGQVIPVVQVGPYRLKSRITLHELRYVLEKALQDEGPTTSRAKTNSLVLPWTRADEISYWLTRHYLALFNGLMFIFLILLPLMAPVLMKAGWVTPSFILYKVYGATCHQLGYRSFFLFGEQVIYPRTEAGLDGFITFEGATGLSEAGTPEAILAARDYLGDERVGYKVALCERDVAIYAAIFLFGLLFAISRRKIPPLAWYLWLLIGLVPIGLDGVSQIISQPPLNLLPFRESIPAFRLITGSLFGFCTTWFGLPLVDQTMQDSIEAMAERRARLVKKVS